MEGGVRHLCLSPGSRSSPLALAAHADARITISLQIDERSAAFLALGIAKATRAPVALVCTSGTAAANYLPAIAEASLAGVPLVALTADRPPELRGTGASQTIDQVELYGSQVRLFRDLPCPDDAGSTEAIAMNAAREACVMACAAPIGPVHLNVPFREPLVPAPAERAACEAQWRARNVEQRVAGVAPRRALPGLRSLTELAARLEKARRPLLIAGPGAVSVSEAAAVYAFARAAAVPVFADIASGLRGSAAPEGVTVCALADLFLRDEAMAALAPDFVLRIGGIPTSKTIATWLARHRPRVVAIQPDARRRDPDGIVGEVIVAHAAEVCEALASSRGKGRGEWESLLRTAEAGARTLLEKAPREAAAVMAACGSMPAGAALFLSSSMPIRWAEFYVPKLAQGVEVFVNRGANGIDGIVSTAIGVAKGSGAPTLLVVGDLAFLHDAGGLRAARDLRTPMAILLLENGGGGIFSHLPVAQHADAFEPLFGTPHGCDLSAVSRACGIEHHVAASLEEVASLTSATLSGGGVRVIEWRTDRAQAVREQVAVTRLPGVQRTRSSRKATSGWCEAAARAAASRLFSCTASPARANSGCRWRTPAEPALHLSRPARPRRHERAVAAGSVAPRSRIRRAAGLARCDGRRPLALAGYSMGGRLALALALRHPGRVDRAGLDRRVAGHRGPGRARAPRRR